MLGLDFAVVHPPTLVGLKPSFGVSRGGSIVTVAGQHLLMPSGNPIDCVFGGSQRVEATVVSHEEVLCVAPAHGEGQVSLALDARGSVSAESTSLTFVYDSPLVVTSLRPSWGVPEEPVTITISGESFPAARGLVCVFGGMHIRPSTHISTTELTCKVPTDLVGNSTVEVGFEGGTSEPALVGMFQTRERTRMVYLTPSFGPVGGQTRVGISLAPQNGMPSPTSFRCVFGSEIVVGDVDNGVAICASPSVSVIGTVDVQIHGDGVFSLQS